MEKAKEGNWETYAIKEQLSFLIERFGKDRVKKVLDLM